MKFFQRSVIFVAFLARSSNAWAVSIAEMASKCGGDGETYCADVGYGDEMQDCLNVYYAELGSDCRGVMDRLNDGERVTFF